MEMQFIWYNSLERKYEFGSSMDFRSLKSNSPNSEALTIVMEFQDEDGTMVNKVLSELNKRKEDPPVTIN